MAARFWVGGTGSWDLVTTTNWAASSGGAGGASVPTSSDDVTFDSSSGTGTCSITVGTANANTVTVNSTNITLTCSTFGLTVVGAVTLTAGTLDTNGQTCSWGSFSSSNSNARTLTLGASAITIAGTGTAWTTATTTSLTITANTAVITLSGAGVTWTSGSISYNGASVTMTGSGTAVFTSTGTFANFTRTGTAVKTDALTISSAFTVTSTVTLAGNTTQGVNRLLVQSSTVGTQRTITAAAYVINGDVDFMDINLAYSGGASWTNAGSAYIGDALGNAGAVTTNATVSATQTATGTASFTWSTHGWTTRVPLPQDDVVINNAFVAGRTITADMPRLGRSIDASACTGSPIINYSTGCSIFGSLAYSTGMTTSGASTCFWRGRGAYTITSNGVTQSMAGAYWTLLCPGGTYTLADNYVAVKGIDIQAGTFSASTFNVTLPEGCATGGTLTAVLNLGSGTWTFSGTGTVFDFSRSGLTVNGGSAIIDITGTTSASKTVKLGGFTYGTLRHIATGTAALTITGNNTFAALDLECTTARTVTLPASGTQTITGSVTLAGASGQNLSLVSSTPSTSTTLSSLTVTPTINAFLTFSADILAFPVNTVAPVASGTPSVGSLLSTTNGTWTQTPSSYTYQWQRDNSGGGTYSNIASATASTYRVVVADASSNDRVQVQAINAYGWSPLSASNAIGLILGGPYIFLLGGGLTPTRPGIGRVSAIPGDFITV